MPYKYWRIIIAMVEKTTALEGDGVPDAFVSVEEMFDLDIDLKVQKLKYL